MIRGFIFALAAISGMLAAYLASRPHTVSMEARADTQLVANMTEVLVAENEIGFGMELSEKHFEWQSWPSTAVSEDFVLKEDGDDVADSLVGVTSKGSFQSGEPIRISRLKGDGTTYLSTNLPSGKRAVAVKISAHNTAGGFILPEDRVDVLHTETIPSKTGIEASTRTILTNVRVLAVDQKSQEKDSNVSVIGKTATLEVDPYQAEVVASAELSGSISLSLRAITDSQEEPSSSMPSTIRFIRSGKVETIRVGTGS